MTLRTNINVEKIIRLDTPESAYILGFIWGDAYIYKNEIRLECVSVDIENILPVFNFFGRWNFSSRKREGRQPQSLLQISSKSLCDFLRQYGYGEKSGGTMSKIIDRFSPELVHYWVRGLFDADGCFYFNEKNNCRQMSLASTYEQDWGALEQIFSSLKIKYKISRRLEITKTGKEQRHSVIRVSNRKGVKIFGDYIYKGKYFGLRRKYEKFLKINGIKESKAMKFIKFNGKRQCIIDWSKEYGVSSGLLYSRLARGCPIEKALTTKSRNKPREVIKCL